MLPLEIELLIAAWDNVKKNVFDAEGMNIDPETGEILGGDIPPDLGDIVADLDDKMCDLISHYRLAEEPDWHADESSENIRETAATL
jgi:hypothetical protein